MRLSALFEEFCHYLRVEREAAPRSIKTYQWCFGDFMEFAQKKLGGTVLIGHFTAETCRAYQYDLSARGLKTNTIRVRLATLGSFGKWAVRRERLDKNPLDLLTRPRRKRRLPRVPRFSKLKEFIADSTDRREQAMLALMAYGALRRSEVVSLDVDDFVADFGLRRVKGKGDKEEAVPLPKAACQIVAEYLSQDRKAAQPGDPMFMVRYRTRGGAWCERRMSDHRVWKNIKALGRRTGVTQLHPHAFRHSSAVELLRRSGGNLRAVQAHLRHSDIQTTTIYTEMTQNELQKVVKLFDDGE
jgi:integrase/recombinase XerC